MSSDHLASAADFEAFLMNRGVDPASLTMTEGGTFCPPGTSPAVERLLEDLPMLVGEGREYQVFAPIGAGGMGEVLMARQRSLGRHVAVKRALLNDALGRTVLAEARVAGALEHPNIVPVYGLARAEDGAPVIVMKKIEGRPWSQLLHARGALRQDKDVHVGHLIKICNAIAFAHARGILHCDLKPANVMIGDFGEAYVLDWGVAAALPGRGPADIRQADHITTIAGTPHYLPPEVARLDGRISEASDVYLLGGLLCVILTGKPPHHGGSATDLMLSAARGDVPSFPAGAPEDLVDLCCRALAAEPSLRPPSARSFQTVLEEHLQRGGARRLIRFGQSRLAHLKELCAAEHEDRSLVRRVFIEASFAFAAAGQEWPESVIAEAGRVTTLTAMIRHELRSQRPESAALLLGELGDVPADLVAELQAQEAKRHRDAARVERLEGQVAESDARVGTHLRGLVMLTLALVWIASQVLLRWLPIVDGAPLSDMAAGLVGHLTQMTLAALLVYRLRARLLGHGGSRVTTIQIIITLVLMLITWLCGWALGLGMPAVLAFTHLVMGMGAAAISVRIREVAPGALVLIAAAPAIAAFPSHAFAINATSILLAFGAYAVASPWIEARAHSARA